MLCPIVYCIQTRTAIELRAIALTLRLNTLGLSWLLSAFIGVYRRFKTNF
ncbi:MAG: hypothetical protein RMY34_28655 [Aulosira sp. DedQUE10]|nr:hypothetical protein [Aulosira sp. DedQUE10]